MSDISTAISTYKVGKTIFEKLKDYICKILIDMTNFNINFDNHFNKKENPKKYPFKFLCILFRLFSNETLIRNYFSNVITCEIRPTNKIYTLVKGQLNQIMVFGNPNNKVIDIGIMYLNDSKQFRVYIQDKGLSTPRFTELKNNYIFSISEYYHSSTIKSEICKYILIKNNKRIEGIFQDILEDYKFDFEDREILKNYYDLPN